LKTASYVFPLSNKQVIIVDYDALVRKKYSWDIPCTIAGSAESKTTTSSMAGFFCFKALKALSLFTVFSFELCGLLFHLLYSVCPTGLLP
jgi:hypothetical protein